MRIAVFSVGPLFPRHVHGGSQRTLEAVVRHLSAVGHEVSVYCTRRADNHDEFSLGARATVYPVLRFRPTYPEPYYAAPFELAGIVETLGRAAHTHDRFYVHDGELLYHFLYDGIPTVVAFQDFVYPDTMAGALSFRRDRLVLSSDYVGACVRQVFGRFRPLPADTVRVVPNGFDLSVLRPIRSEAMRAELGLAPDVLPVLYPHRPDPRKGIVECLTALLAALEQLPAAQARRVRMLVPVWMDSRLDSAGAEQYRDFYRDVCRQADEAGWPDLVYLHSWIDTDRMNEYLSLGKVVLCIGSFIEAFGNSSVEAQLCGTPAIVSRVGAQRSVLPEELIQKVDYGDDKSAADLLLAALDDEPLYPYEQLREYVAEHYSAERMVRGYAEAITTVRHGAPLPGFAAPTLAVAPAVAVPAWCASLSSGYYNDYAYGYATDERLLGIVARAGDAPVRRTELLGAVDDVTVDEWIAGGYLTPVGSR